MSDTASATECCQHVWTITYPFDGGDSRTDRPVISVCSKCGKQEKGVRPNIYNTRELREIFSELMLYDTLRTELCKNMNHDEFAVFMKSEYGIDIKEFERPEDWDEQGRNTAGEQHQDPAKVQEA